MIKKYIIILLVFGLFISTSHAVVIGIKCDGDTQLTLAIQDLFRLCWEQTPVVPRIVARYTYRMIETTEPKGWLYENSVAISYECNDHICESDPIQATIVGDFYYRIVTYRNGEPYDYLSNYVNLTVVEGISSPTDFKIQ